MKKAISSEISEELFNELTEFLKKNGMSKKFFIAKAIEEKIKNDTAKMLESKGVKNGDISA